MSPFLSTSTKRLQRTVGLVLANAAAKYRRAKKKNSYAYDYSELTMSKLRDGIIEIELGAPYADGWYELQKALKDKKGQKLRKALKYWEDKGKVQARRHGRSGNGYTWTLFAKAHEWSRSIRKRKIREAEAEEATKDRDKCTKIAQMIADQLSAKAGLGIGVFTAWNNTITITRQQAELMIIKLSSLGL